ncbi:MAG TPA: phosphotransferase family protein [Dehalococcoidia bacterium]|nr:phosphotransferase family protein [Dehalococcoidia bacterium]
MRALLESRIAQYLAPRLGADNGVAVSGLFRIPGGQSRETWSFDAAWRENGAELTRGFILRRDPDASLLESDRDLEFRVMDAVRAHGVPVPEMYWMEQDASYLDRPFALMQRLDGCEANPTKVLMDPAYFPARNRMAEEFTRILARIHAIDVAALDLGCLGHPPAPAACGPMEVEKWERIVAQEALEPQPVLRAAFRWLRKHPPRPAQKIVLVHADYRTGNFLARPDGEIVGILDWEMTHVGDPLEDVAWACIRPWRWIGTEHVGGLMDRADFYRMYEEDSGLKIDEESVRFWEILGNAKLAAIFLTGGRSYCEGRTRSAMMAFLGRNVSRLELEIMDLMRV